MGKAKVLELTEAQRLELERGFRMGEKHCFRMRCRAVLLKADGLSAAKAGAQTEMNFVSVNAWVRRYKEEGIKGLHTRSGRGRKLIMDSSDRMPCVVPSNRTGNAWAKPRPPGSWLQARRRAMRPSSAFYQHWRKI